jgi:hypothetical protein
MVDNCGRVTLQLGKDIQSAFELTNNQSRRAYFHLQLTHRNVHKQPRRSSLTMCALRHSGGRHLILIWPKTTLMMMAKARADSTRIGVRRPRISTQLITQDTIRQSMDELNPRRATILHRRTSGCLCTTIHHLRLRTHRSLDILSRSRNRRRRMNLRLSGDMKSVQRKAHKSTYIAETRLNERATKILRR